MQNKVVEFRHLGLLDYQKALDYQEKLFKKTIDLKIKNRNQPPDAQEITPNYLLFLYHPHVYTLGKSGKEDHLLLDKEGLLEKEATYHRISRGGDITYHGPGQIVGYPILDLDNFFTDIHKYLRFLEEAVIRTLASYDIVSGRIEGLTGVWLDVKDLHKARKICAFGVKSSRWVTMHGLALNVNVDLDYFKNIVPCGIDDKAVTSMHQELGRLIPLTEVEERLRQHISELFQIQWKEDTPAMK
ncbi:lipoyl(octanoyl) transferase LipB [Cyclobacteriaceae bacterium]|nr:lipoyl(octanoyl) transferase LipB [Cyclobacteriaceae bacterium]MDB4315521.1 lipoyl(octanoyl) transferase LipB [Cyclobacteriaceae bacterium]MDB4742645.1 lipoyl(octanoyl) transferase LipB [Cyclobacteriaceae bacterium]